MRILELPCECITFIRTWIRDIEKSNSANEGFLYDNEKSLGIKRIAWVRIIKSKDDNNLFTVIVENRVQGLHKGCIDYYRYDLTTHMLEYYKTEHGSHS